MKKILFCTPARLQKSLGHAKVIVELAEEMQVIGWDCDFVCPWDVAASDDTDPSRNFSPRLKTYLKFHAGDYDVVDYDHAYLPYARSEFAPSPLFVARSVLLALHLEKINIPSGDSIKSKIGMLVYGKQRNVARQRMIHQAQVTLEAADLVNVSNDDDKSELVRRGMRAGKITVIPYGISRSRRPLFDSVSSLPPMRPIVAFVGTFDYRKGAREFPLIVESIAQQVPDVRFRLLGVKGMLQTEKDVLGFFPKSLVDRLDTVLTYSPDDLPDLLKDCSVGVFPSYLEGFGFGVLEMLAASIPVIAYEAPGPPMMLPYEYLVRRGNWKALSQKVIALLQNRDDLGKARIWAKQRSQDFDWCQIAKVTSETYLEKLFEHRSKSIF